MKKPLIYIICIILIEAAGFMVGMLTREGTQIYADTLNKPVLSPPGIVFPIAWTILYALMGVSAARVILSDGSKARSMGLVFFGIQLALNLAWSFIFFGVQRFGFALIELLVMVAAVIAMTVQFMKCDPLAAKLQIPYIAWLCFATYLNAAVMVLN